MEKQVDRRKQREGEREKSHNDKALRQQKNCRDR